MLSDVLGSVYILAGVGLVFATFIAIASRKLRVYEDPRIEVVAGMLPGANCGACGLPGCHQFAEQAVLGAVKPAACNVIDAAGAAAIATYLGVDVGEANRKVARLLCAGGTDVAVQEAEYRGLETCAAAAAVAGGGKACAWGCLFYGDCATSCTFGAITMLANGLPRVDVALCTACGDCVDACPKGLLQIVPLDQKLIVQCRSLVEGDEALEACRVACTSCGKCVVDAAPGVVSIATGVAVVDYARNGLADPSATRRCPTGAIAWVDGAQFVAAPLQRRRDEALIGSERA